MKLHKAIVGILLITNAATCYPQVNPATPQPYPPPDTDSCGAMCEHLDSLHCAESKPVYDSDLRANISCIQWCTEMQMKGLFLNPACVSKVESCDQIESARQKDPKGCH